jgi:hypothetical protein
MRAELVAGIARHRAGEHEVAADRLAIEPFGLLVGDFDVTADRGERESAFPSRALTLPLTVDAVRRASGIAPLSSTSPEIDFATSTFVDSDTTRLPLMLWARSGPCRFLTRTFPEIDDTSTAAPRGTLTV